MKVGIVGATGNGGRALYMEAVKREHEVTAMAREPDGRVPCSAWMLACSPRTPSTWLVMISADNCCPFYSGRTDRRHAQRRSIAIPVAALCPVRHRGGAALGPLCVAARVLRQEGARGCRLEGASARAGHRLRAGRRASRLCAGTGGGARQAAGLSRTRDPPAPGLIVAFGAHGTENLRRHVQYPRVHARGNRSQRGRAPDLPALGGTFPVASGLPGPVLTPCA